MDTLSKFITPGLALILTLIFGFWLSKLGKPYNGILFNIHKLIALGTVIVTAMQVYKILKNLDAQASFIVLLIVAGLCVVALFASGAFMSIGNLNYQAMRTIHRIALALGFIVMAVTVYLLNGRTL